MTKQKAVIVEKKGKKVSVRSTMDAQDSMDLLLETAVKCAEQLNFSEQQFTEIARNMYKMTFGNGMLGR